MDEIIITGLITGEEKYVSELIDRVFDEFVAPGYSEEGIKVFKDFIASEEIKKHVENGYIFLVAKSNGSVIGMIAVRDTNHISLLFVDKNFQGNGIARNLFEKALSKSYEINPELLEFNVNSSPYAVEVYRRLGFEKTGEEQEINGIRFIPMVNKLERSRSYE